MKKAIFLLCAVLMVTGLEAGSNKMTIDLNVGLLTDKDLSFNPIFWSLGAELDIPLGKIMFISPELLFVSYKFEFKHFLVFPGALLNVKFGSFFAGGGVTKAFFLSGGTMTEIPDAFFLKVNAGLISDNLKITAYIDTPFTSEAFKDFIFGITLGFRL
jgi:hypothetical protein